MSKTDRSQARALIGVAIAVVTLVLSAGIASAHEHRTVGDYTLTVGFLNEPAIDEEPNGLDFRVAQGSGTAAKPVTGVAATLKAEVKFGGQTMPLTLSPVFNVDGSYKANFIPTAAGPYTFHVYGTINDTKVDESFTSGPKTFSEVADSTSMQFPAKVPPVASVSQTANDASSTANSVQSTADSAHMFGIIGMVVGVLGLIAGVGGLMMARSSRTSAHPTDDRGEMGSPATRS